MTQLGCLLFTLLFSLGSPAMERNVAFGYYSLAAKGGKSFVPDAAWTKNAPKQVAPGTKMLEHTKFWGASSK